MSPYIGRLRRSYSSICDSRYLIYKIFITLFLICQHQKNIYLIFKKPLTFLHLCVISRAHAHYYYYLFFLFYSFLLFSLLFSFFWFFSFFAFLSVFLFFFLFLFLCVSFCISFRVLRYLEKPLFYMGFSCLILCLILRVTQKNKPRKTGVILIKFKILRLSSPFQPSELIRG